MMTSCAIYFSIRLRFYYLPSYLEWCFYKDYCIGWQPDQTASLHCCQKGWLGTYSLFFVRNPKQFAPALSCDCLECVRACRVHVSRPCSRIGTDKDLLGVHLLTKLIVFPSQILFSLGNATIVMATIDVHLSFWERLTPVYLKLLTSWSCCPFT